MVWFNKEIKLFCAKEKSSVIYPIMDKEREGPPVLPLLANGIFDMSKVFEV